MTNTHSGKYLTFKLCSEMYGVEILKVREIIGYMPVTEMPQMSNYIKGVINLRGKVVPIMDLRLKFGMSEAEITEETCIIVIESVVAGSKKQLGIVVDSVSEVISLSEDVIEPAPELGGVVDLTLIMGVAKLEKSIVILLAVDKAFFDEKLGDMLPELDEEVAG